MNFRLMVLLLLTCTLAFGESKKRDVIAATALLHSYETVARSSPAILSSNSPRAIFMNQPFWYLDLVLKKKQEHFRGDLLEQSESLLLGAKNFSFPEGLGPIVASRTYVVVLREGTQFSIANYIGRSSYTVDGIDIWKWSVQIQEYGAADRRESTLYATVVGKGFFVLSNDAKELELISSSLRDRHSQTMNRDLKPVVSHEFWMYRRYSIDNRPSASEANGLAGIGPNAKGIYLFGNIDRPQAKLRYLSSDPNDTTASNLVSIWKLPAAYKLDNYTWETSFSVSNAGSMSPSSVSALWLFGFGEVV